MSCCFDGSFSTEKWFSKINNVGACLSFHNLSPICWDYFNITLIICFCLDQSHFSEKKMNSQSSVIFREKHTKEEKLLFSFTGSSFWFTWSCCRDVLCAAPQCSDNIRCRPIRSELGACLTNHRPSLRSSCGQQRGDEASAHAPAPRPWNPEVHRCGGLEPASHWATLTSRQPPLNWWMPISFVNVSGRSWPPTRSDKYLGSNFF